MTRAKANRGGASPSRLQRLPTGIDGLDALTGGGLPAGRTTLIVGAPGCGKTVCALQTLATAARSRNEAGIFVAFEESARNIAAHAAPFGWELPRLQAKKLFFLEARLSPSVVQAGAFDLAGLLAAVEAKRREIGARRVVFDGLDALLDLLGDPAAERREAYRLRDWLSESGLTGIITAKSDSADLGAASRYSHLQYLADCVILLQHRLVGQTAVRGLRVLKYRGAAHSANEAPFLIGPSGVEVGAVDQGTRTVRVSRRRISSGVERLDRMLGGGYYEGSAVLVSGAPGTAKSTLAAAFAAAAARRGERTLYASFDEPSSQIVRNMRSVGIDLERTVREGMLRILSFHARGASAEEHAVRLRAEMSRGAYAAVVIDPISALAHSGGSDLSLDALLRLLNAAKEQGVTVFMTTILDSASGALEATPTAVSTLADTWIQLSYVIRAGERNRALTIIKSRGTAHSNQVRELVLSRRGLTLADVYTAGGEVLMGALRWQKEQEERRERERETRAAEKRREDLALAVAHGEAQVEIGRRELEARRAELANLDTVAAREARGRTQRSEGLRRLRRADRTAAPGPRRRNARA
jgi:circadian clock protein KaiC